MLLDQVNLKLSFDLQAFTFSGRLSCRGFKDRDISRDAMFISSEDTPKLSFEVLSEQTSFLKH